MNRKQLAFETAKKKLICSKLYILMSDLDCCRRSQVKGVLTRLDILTERFYRVQFKEEEYKKRTKNVARRHNGMDGSSGKRKHETLLNIVRRRLFYKHLKERTEKRIRKIYPNWIPLKNSCENRGHAVRRDFLRDNSHSRMQTARLNCLYSP